MIGLIKGQVLKLRSNAVPRSTALREKPGFVSELKRASRFDENLSRYSKTRYGQTKVRTVASQ